MIATAMPSSLTTRASYSRRSLSLTKVVWFVVHLAVWISSVRARSCYYPNGDLSTSTDVPCSLAEDGPCCPQGWQCLSNGLCYLQNANYLGRYTCTDPTWKSPSCPQICTHDNTAAGDEAILECTPGQYCCDANRPDADNPPKPGCCDTGAQRFFLPSGSPIPSGQNYVYSIASQPGGPTAAGGGGGGGQPATTQSQPAPQPTSDTTTTASQGTSTSSSSSSTSTTDSFPTTSTDSSGPIPSTTVPATVTQSGVNAIGTSPGSSQTPSTSNKNGGSNNNSNNHSNGTASVIIPAVVVPVVVILVALIIAVILWRRRRRNRTARDDDHSDIKPSSPSLGSEKPPPQYTSPDLRSSSPVAPAAAAAAPGGEAVGAVDGQPRPRTRPSWAPTAASSTAGYYPYDPNTAYQHDNDNNQDDDPANGKSPTTAGPAAGVSAGGAAATTTRRQNDHNLNLNRLSEIDGREIPAELPGSIPSAALPRYHRYPSTQAPPASASGSRPAHVRGSSANKEEPWGRYYRG